jgi:hypothetical protein
MFVGRSVTRSECLGRTVTRTKRGVKTKGQGIVSDYSCFFIFSLNVKRIVLMLHIFLSRNAIVLMLFLARDVFDVILVQERPYECNSCPKSYYSDAIPV